MPIYGVPSLKTVVPHVATSIQASCARYMVGAMPSLYTTVLRVTTSISTGINLNSNLNSIFLII